MVQRRLAEIDKMSSPAKSPPNKLTSSSLAEGSAHFAGPDEFGLVEERDEDSVGT